jgi:catalase
VVAPRGGTLSNGMTVQRVFAATRSVEFDAVLVAGRPVPAADALTVRDSKAGGDADPGLEPRVTLLLAECFRHAKVIGAWGEGIDALEKAGVTGTAGIVTGDDPAAVFAALHAELGAHRVWERFDTTMA